MTLEHETFLKIGRMLDGAEESQLFGKPCFKINGKAFICYFENAMVFKLNGDIHSEALLLEGSHLFDPSHKNRPMKEWVQVPYLHKMHWANLSKAAFTNVQSNNNKK